MSHAPYRCRKCGELLGTVKGDEIEVPAGAAVAYEVRLREVRVACPTCAKVRTFQPSRRIVRVVRPVLVLH